MTGHIYFLRRASGGPIKIGFSIDPWDRIKGLQTGCSDDLVFLGVLSGTMDDELDLHEGFTKYRGRGEWFEPAQEILEFISENCHALEKPEVQEKVRRPRKGLSPLELDLFKNVAYEIFGKRAAKRETARAAGVTEKAVENWFTGASTPGFDSLTALNRSHQEFFLWFQVIVVTGALASHAGITQDAAVLIVTNYPEYITLLFLSDLEQRPVAFDCLLSLSGDCPRAECLSYLESLKGDVFRRYEKGLRPKVAA